MSKIDNDSIIDATEVSIILNCSRGTVERLQIKGLLIPIPTIHPKYYFDKNQIQQYKNSIKAKKEVQNA